jgi:sec-independent protein translocase protein TatC
MAAISPDRMTFLEHLDELRVRLMHSLGALVVGTIVCWGFHERIFHFLTQPLRNAYPAVKFITTGPTEAFMMYMKMSFFVGIFLVAPYILYQVWAFIAPGLYAHEKAYAVPFIVAGSLFFLLGGGFGHYILFPTTFKFLYEFAGDDMQFLPKVDEYFEFYSWFLLGLGLVFQIPVIIFVLARIGIVTPGFLMRQFKFAVLVSFVVAAIVTPSADVVNQTLLALPMMGLYLLGVLVAWMFGRARQTPEGVRKGQGGADS